MFVLTVMRQVVRIPPQNFNDPPEIVIGAILNEKFANKVILNVGLCIALRDIEKREEAFFLPGDAGAFTKVTFRFIVFRPAIEEVLEGKVRSSSPEGVRVSLGFFSNILIPPSALQHPYKFDETELVWVWEYPGENGPHPLCIDLEETIKFRVIGEQFVDCAPGGDSQLASLNSNPYTITASINEPGLGLKSWWEGQDIE